MSEEEIELQFTTQFNAPDVSALADGYNEYGVKEVRDDDGELEQVEFIFEAMQPGEPTDRNGFEITANFIEKVSSKDYSDEVPFQMSHNRDQRSNAGFIDRVWTSDGAMRLHGYVPNTGNDLRSDVIADLTHEPPALRDGSVGFGTSYEYEITDEGYVRPTDATLMEFSATPFPGGYEKGEGGLKAQFVKAAVEAGVFDEESGASVSGSEKTFARDSGRSLIRTTEI